MNLTSYVLPLSLLAFTLCGRVASAQAQISPKKRDNVVLIQTPDSAVAALRKLGQAFVAQGYTIEKLDKEFLTLTVAPKVLEVKASPRLVARASATEGASSTLRLTGDFDASIAGRPFGGPAYYQGSYFQIESKVFQALEKVALTYPSGQVSYTKQ